MPLTLYVKNLTVNLDIIIINITKALAITFRQCPVAITPELPSVNQGHQSHSKLLSLAVRKESF